MDKTSSNIPSSVEYKVLTEQDVEHDLFNMMQTAGVAVPVAGEAGKLRIVDVTQASSENSMPKLLNKLGAEGWELVGVNFSQLYLFQRPEGGQGHGSWEYKVLTLAGLDKLIFSRLVAQKAAEPVQGQPGKYKILDVEKAKSQTIMAEVLTAFGKEGWQFSGTNKGNLYMFRRPGNGSIAFDKPVAAALPSAPTAAATAPTAAAPAVAAKTEAKVAQPDAPAAKPAEAKKPVEPAKK